MAQDAPRSQPTRRERYRAQTIREIKEHALRRLAELGPDGLSLNAIARAMGITGPALYRYYASRDALIEALTDDAYQDLVQTVRTAVDGVPAGEAGNRLRVLMEAFRGWALTQPHRYLLAFKTPLTGTVPPRAATRHANSVVAAILCAVVPHESDTPARFAPEGPGVSLEQERQEQWSTAGSCAGVDGPVPARALLIWSRIHGLVDLEVTGQFSALGLDPSALYCAEAAALIGEPG
ncbi:TetR/AcrR family transcriptional regulator [Nocardiopsis ansamitocini]|uniref:TetR family transcriptional regulator n=1 Tax=Nocardiopsis ansamitocini TaxID=1670832 RepID=A0A9W6P3R2_9ACTN|nr:TetR/AcrR family transcriptional regulator [Nocardiopsis ansamitocini]GLU46735.1 TetR family transcriptional regulator [Nocardiopsis ansamitocini]